MKSAADRAVGKEKRAAELTASARKIRRACNELSDEQRRELLEEGLRIIHGSDAKKTIRSH